MKPAMKIPVSRLSYDLLVGLYGENLVKRFYTPVSFVML